MKILEDFLEDKCTITDVLSFYNTTNKKSGVVYTPWHIAYQMVELAKINPTDTVLEPSVGHGVFLFAMLEYMQKNNENIDLQHWFLTQVTALEISKDSIVDLKDILGAYFKKLGYQEAEYKNILYIDALDYEQNQDVCIGNPPYVRIQNIESSQLEKIRAAYVSCKTGNIDLYYAFVEKFSKSSKRLVFITPNGFLSNKSGKVLKDLISSRMTYLKDFKEQLVFDKIRTYTCIFCLEGTMAPSSAMITKKDVHYTVYSGVATLKDSVYIVKKVDDKYYAGDTEVEEGICVPYYKLTKQRTNAVVQYMIYPYIERHVMPEDVLKENYPMAYDYLVSQKSVLSQRDKGKGQYEAWYAYGRRQGLHTIPAGSVTVVPQMIGGKSVPFILQVSGPFVFTSGFIVEGAHPDLLEQSFRDFVCREGRVWPGGYHSITSMQLKSYKSIAV